MTDKLPGIPRNPEGTFTSETAKAASAKSSTQFKKGTSGNPGGLKRGKKLREEFLPLRPKAVQRVAEALDDPDRKIRMQASQIVFDRTDGRPLAASEVLLRDERELAVVAKAVLTPEEVKAGVADVMARAAAEMGMAATGIAHDELARQIRAAREAGEPEPPSLYEATLGVLH